jgi:hypothetical protein
MCVNVRLFEKGIKQFSDKDVQQQLVKYLLKTLCTEITNEVFSYVAQENMIRYDQAKELSPEVRVLFIFMYAKKLFENNAPLPILNIEGKSCITMNYLCLQFLFI